MTQALRWIIEPEVAAQLGDLTEMDVSVHPPVVTRLHFAFDGWLGDDLLETFPCFAVTERLASAIERSGLTGWRVDELIVTTSAEFVDLHPEMRLPEFRWLIVNGDATCDFSLSSCHRLVVSERALSVLRGHRLDQAVVEPAG